MPHFASAAAAIGITLCLLSGTPSAQDADGHLSGLVDTLARGERAYGVSTYDLSLENARSLARADIDYLYVDMEHGPMDFAALQGFMLGMIDKQAIAESGSVRQRVAPLARIPPYGRDSSGWVVKQALDIGLMGLIFPSIETPEQALAAVRSMRYPQRRDSRYPSRWPARRGDPDRNVVLGAAGSRLRAARRPVAAQPRGRPRGVHDGRDRRRCAQRGRDRAGAGRHRHPDRSSDLSNSLGLPRDDPEVEAAIETIAGACRTHGVTCAITASAADMPHRIAQGFTMLGGGRAGGGLGAANDAAIRAGRAVRD